MRLRTQLLAGYMVVFALMILIAGVMHQSTSALIENQAQVERTHGRKAEARLLMRLLVDMETGVRGFGFTGEEVLLEPFETARPAYRESINDLTKRMANHPEQLARLGEIEASADRWLNQVAIPIIELRRSMKKDAGLEDLRKVMLLVEKESAKELMDSLRDKVQKFIAVERGNLIDRQENAKDSASESLWIVIASTILAIGLGFVAMWMVTHSIMQQVGGEPGAIAAITEEIAKGNLEIGFENGGEKATGIRASVDAMLSSLRLNRDYLQKQDWLKNGIAKLNGVMTGDPDVSTLASRVIAEMSSYMNAQVGAFYIMNDDNSPVLSLVGSYAFTKRKNLANSFAPGESLVGQAALEKQPILLSNVPEDYTRITSGLGERVPRFICVIPFMYEGNVRGVIELGTLEEITELNMEYLKQAMTNLAIAVESARSREELAKSLTESQQLSEELQAQQEELRVANEELEQQTRRLQDSEERLKAQQEELEVTNEELEEKNDLLDRQKREVDIARENIEKKAGELALASKYKSEFLANMSHELRTPLNSLLLLAQGLTQNKKGNLTDEQVESAKIIHSSGSDLLSLINEILDLSKIEAGKMDLKVDTVHLDELSESLRASFCHMAESKGLYLKVEMAPDAPAKIRSDRKRIEQVIRNLVSNAIKFTETGGVTVKFGKPDSNTEFNKKNLAADSCFYISVMDTGIGINPAQQNIIFEAFQQADGGTSRKYGGTGLGLSISRELANLLGGEIRLESTPEKGSVFTLLLPLEVEEGKNLTASLPAPVTKTIDNDVGANPHISGKPADKSPKVEDDRNNLQSDNKVILIIEDDPRFAAILRDKCHGKGFKSLIANNGEAGLELAHKHHPSAVILDIRLPGMDGWAVLNELKENIGTRHIPVHIISAEESSIKAMARGAIGHAVKPLSQEGLDEVFDRFKETADQGPHRVLVVEDNPEVMKSTVSMISSDDVTVDKVENGNDAIEALRSGKYDCMVLDLKLPDMDGSSLLKKAKGEGIELPPVIVHTARELTEDEERDLREHAESIVIKDVRSQERLLDEVSLFLHRIVNDMPERARKIIRDLHDTDALLRNKKILIVDDDMRTTFALSHMLSERGMKTLKAENGKKALTLLDDNPDVDLVLMDIMMPVMDGYETMTHIRKKEAFRKIPIIVLTAKAMNEDREKCILAGANDYLPKPVNPDRLISMMRVWLYR